MEKDVHHRRLTLTGKEAEKKIGTGMQVGLEESHLASGMGEGVCVRGDALMKCYHLSSSNKKTPMFRFSFHTAFIGRGVLQVTFSSASPYKIKIK